jgi:hypothetical protein
MNGAQLSALDETLNRARVDMEEVSCIVRRQSGSPRQAATNLPKTLRAEAGRSTSVRADASSHPIGEATLLGDELERQVEAAGAHQLEQRLHARNDGPRSQRAMTARSRPVRSPSFEHAATQPARSRNV